MQKGWLAGAVTGLDEGRIIRIMQAGIGGGGSGGGGGGKRRGKKFTPEDVEVFGRGSARMAVAVDTVVQGTDVPPGMRMQEVARKSVAACVSDFAAKGVRPEFGVISLVMPEGMPEGQVRRLAGGFEAAAGEFGVRILGGDTGGGAELVISVTLCGRAAGGIVPRGGASDGDAIFATGAFGNTAAGLRLLLSSGGRRRPRAGSAGRRYVDAFCSPEPRLEFGARVRGDVSSSMDSSDGLAATLNEMARQSGTRFVVSELPCEKTLEGFVRKNKIGEARDLVLFGGEEYEIVFTAPQRNAPGIRRIARDAGVRLTRIGTVRRGGRAGAVMVRDGGVEEIPDRGWTHLTGRGGAFAAR